MVQTTTTKTQSKIGLIFLAYIAFISLGLPDGLLGVAWPSIRTDFRLPLDALGLYFIAGTAGYLTSAFFSGKLMARMGVGGLLAASCFATGASLLGYTQAPVWGVMVGLATIAGFGAGAIDAGINTYIASEHGEGLMQWLHASFGVGVTLGPIIMITGINQFESWRIGYVVVGVAQLALALCFALTAAMWKRAPGTVETAKAEDSQRLIDYKTPLLETLRQPGTWVSILLFFIYTGTELTLGYWTYTLLFEGRGIDAQTAGWVAGSYWGMFTLGRILAGLYTRRVSTDTILRASILLALFGAVLVWWNPSQAISLVGVVITGFAIAPIFPALVSGTSDRVTPRHAANTIGMQISAAGLGGATIPGLAGLLARFVGLETIPIYLVVMVSTLLIFYMIATRRKK